MIAIQRQKIYDKMAVVTGFMKLHESHKNDWFSFGYQKWLFRDQIRYNWLPLSSTSDVKPKILVTIAFIKLMLTGFSGNFRSYPE